MRVYHLKTPLSMEDVKKLRIGDRVYLNGVVYTARDMAHIRMMEHIREGKDLPFNLKGAALFHAGPIVRKRDDKWEIVAIGPTASERMEEFEADIIRHYGLRCIIGGVGGMGEKTLEALKKYGAVFLTAHGGCAALNASAIEEVIKVYWLDLGMPEAVWAFRAKEWGPLIVSMDSYGDNLYKKVTEASKKVFLELCESLRFEAKT